MTTSLPAPNVAKRILSCPVRVSSTSSLPIHSLGPLGWLPTDAIWSDQIGIWGVWRPGEHLGLLARVTGLNKCWGGLPVLELHPCECYNSGYPADFWIVTRQLTLPFMGVFFLFCFVIRVPLICRKIGGDLFFLFVFFINTWANRLKIRLLKKVCCPNSELISGDTTWLKTQ